LISKACGYPVSYFGSDLDILKSFLNENQLTGPRMLHMKIKPDTINDLPRPKELPQQVVRRLMKHIGTSL